MTVEEPDLHLREHWETIAAKHARVVQVPSATWAKHCNCPLDRERLSSYLTRRLINRELSNMTADCLNATFSALADPTRRAILARLALGESSVQELARPFKISAPAVTKHLKVLQRVGLITRSRQAQRRPCQLNAKPLREVADWVEHYRRFWDESFDRLEDYLQEIQKEDKKPPRRKK